MDQTTRLFPLCRAFLSMIFAGSAIVAPSAATAQNDAAENTETVSFSFDALTEEMRARAAETYSEPEKISGFAKKLDFDLYRQIRFRPDHARWADTDALFRLQAFHLGWLYDTPVELYQLVDGQAQRLTFTTDDFEYRNKAADLVEPGTELPGVAGFRLHYPLNTPALYDEFLVFQGASYFRALGQGNTYGLSARGLAVDTAAGKPEEFPRFSRFYLTKPAPGSHGITIYAALDSPSVTGAYRFVVHPGATTRMDVTARLFFRDEVTRLGVAPLTSMFLFDEGAGPQFDDYRRQVHDSGGLRIVRSDGDVLWRDLDNPPSLSTSFFAETTPKSFGLYQRDRSFDAYQDAGADYEDRPSLRITPKGDWGDGTITLVEIPTELEINDNIVAFWTPAQPVGPGDAREFAYTMTWGDLSPPNPNDVAHVSETRSGAGGVSGVKKNSEARKFVVDFEGGRLGRLEGDANVKAELSVTHGKVVGQTLSKVAESGAWRLVADVEATGSEPVELVGYLTGYGQRLSETWLYQWVQK